MQTLEPERVEARLGRAPLGGQHALQRRQVRLRAVCARARCALLVPGGVRAHLRA